MKHQLPLRWEQAIARARRDHIAPHCEPPSATGASMWRVPSRSNPAHSYTLTVEGGTIRCQCPAFQQQQICAHAAAVHLELQTPSSEGTSPAVTDPSCPPSRPAKHRRRHPLPRTEEEQRRREEAKQRDRALLWRDEKPFSLLKS